MSYLQGKGYRPGYLLLFIAHDVDERSRPFGPVGLLQLLEHDLRSHQLAVRDQVGDDEVDSLVQPVHWVYSS